MAGNESAGDKAHATGVDRKGHMIVHGMGSHGEL